MLSFTDKSSVVFLLQYSIAITKRRQRLIFSLPILPSLHPPLLSTPPFSPSLMLKPNTLSRFMDVVHCDPFYRSLVFLPRPLATGSLLTP